MTKTVMPLPDFIELMSEPVHIDGWMRQCIIDALTDLQARLTAEPRGECICPTCGLRHGSSNADGGF